MFKNTGPAIKKEKKRGGGVEHSKENSGKMFTKTSKASCRGSQSSSSREIVV